MVMQQMPFNCRIKLCCLNQQLKVLLIENACLNLDKNFKSETKNK